MWRPRRRADREDAAAELARRFAAAYAGDHAPADALFWLDHPDDIAPSGAASPYRSLGDLRDAVYRAAGTAEDRARYAAARALVDADSAAAAAARARIVTELGMERAARESDGRRLRVAALGVAALVIVAGGVALGSAATGSAPVPTPTVSTWIGIDRFPAAPTTPDPPDQGGATQWTTAGSQQVATSTSGTMQVEFDSVPDVFRTAVSASGASGVGLVQVHPSPATGVRKITVAVTCTAPGTYSWIAAGSPNGNGISTAIARSGEHACTGGPSVVTKNATAAPTTVQVSGTADEGFDVYAGEFR